MLTSDIIKNIKIGQKIGVKVDQIIFERACIHSARILDRRDEVLFLEVDDIDKSSIIDGIRCTVKIKYVCGNYIEYWWIPNKCIVYKNPNKKRKVQSQKCTDNQRIVI